MSYVDIFSIPIPKDKLEEYWGLAEQAADLWTEHGALCYREVVLDEDSMPGMQTFVDMTNCGPDDVLVVSWAVYGSKADRDSANEKIMNDPRVGALHEKCKTVFDETQMAFGGFQQRVGRDGAD